MQAGQRVLTRREFVRFALLRVVFLFAFLVLVARLWYLQILHGNEYRTQAESNSLRLVSIKPLRGIIYDAHNERAAINAPAFSVVARPADVPTNMRQAIAQRLAGLVGMSPQDILQRLEDGRGNPYQPVVLKRNVPREVALIIEEENAYLPGVAAESRPIREYKRGLETAHILGYTGPIPREGVRWYLDRGYEQDDQVGLTGVEAAYEQELRGQRGQRRVEVDVRGRTVRVLEETPAVPGHNLVLGLSLRLQAKVTEALYEGLTRAKSPSGTAIVLDVQAGSVLALVSLPAFDNNLFARSISARDFKLLAEDPWYPLVNHAISGLFPPGSVFKIVTLGAGLESGVIKPDTRFECTGQLILPGGWQFSCWYKPGHGLLNAHEALVHSCNIYFYNLAGGNPYTRFPGLGPDRLAQFARECGFGQQTGIDLPSEQGGLVPTPGWKSKVKNEPWYQGDTYNMATGQGDVLVTSVQVATLLAAIANGGRLLRPHAVNEVRTPEGKRLRPIGPEVVRLLPFSPPVVSALQRALRDVVVRGTATGLQSNPYRVAGKTGTAEFPGPRDDNGKLPTHAWFAGYAPDEEPRIAFAVMVYGGGEGSSVAVPIVDKIVRAYFELVESERLRLP